MFGSGAGRGGGKEEEEEKEEEEGVGPLLKSRDHSCPIINHVKNNGK